MIDQGQSGLINYGILLSNIERVLKRNHNIADQLMKYQETIQDV